MSTAPVSAAVDDAPPLSDPQLYRECQLDLPGRPTSALPIYQAEYHPLVPVSGGRTFVVFLDTTKAGMEKANSYEKVQKAACVAASLQEEGWLNAIPQDYVFVACTRVNKSARYPTLDTLAVWVTGRESLEDTEADALDAAQRNALGDRDKRTYNRPRLNEEEDNYDGGTAIERSSRMVQDASSYTIGPSRETPRGIIEPPASSKLASAMAQLDHHLMLRKEVITAITKVATASAKKAGKEIVDVLKLQDDLVNAPKCGDSHSFGSSSMQLNLAHPVQIDPILGIVVLGKSGEIHADCVDALSCHSSVTSHPDIPASYEPGTFQLLLLCLYVSLNKYTTINFSGFMRHAGMPPRPPPGVELQNWETRFTVVKYAQGIAMSGLCRYPIAASPNNVDIWYSTPETRVPELVTTPLGCIKSTTFAREGVTLTNSKAQIEFVTRELYGMVLHALKQLPPSLQVQFNADEFFHAISYKPNGDLKAKCTTVAPWINPPGFRPLNATQEARGEEIDDLVDQTPQRLERFKRIKEREKTLGRILPYAVAGGKVNPLDSEQIETLCKSVHDNNVYPQLSFAVHRKELPSAHLHTFTLPESPKDSITITRKESAKDSTKDSKRKIPSHQFQTTSFFRRITDYKNNSAASAKRSARRRQLLAKKMSKVLKRAGVDIPTKKAKKSGAKGGSQKACGKQQATLQLHKEDKTEEGKVNRESDCAMYDNESDDSEDEFPDDYAILNRLLPHKVIPQKRQWDSTSSDSQNSPEERNDWSPSVVTRTTISTHAVPLSHTYGLQHNKRSLREPITRASSIEVQQLLASDSTDSNDPSELHFGHQDLPNLSNVTAPCKKPRIFVEVPRPAPGSPADIDIEKKKRRVMSSNEIPVGSVSTIKVIPLPSRYSMETLVTDYRELHSLLKHAVWPLNPPPNMCIKSLNALHQSFGATPTSIIHATEILSKTAILDGQQSSQDLVVRISRFYILVAYHWMSCWLEDTVPNACRLLVATSPDKVSIQDTWLANLINAANTMVIQNETSRTFSTSQFLPLAAGSVEKKFVATRKSAYVLDAEEQLAAAIRVVQEVVYNWCVGNTSVERWRLWVLQRLVQSFGIQILASSITWHIFRTASKGSLFRQFGSKLEHIADLSFLSTVLQGHPLASERSAEREALLAVSNVINNLFDLSKSPEGSPNISTISIDRPPIINRLLADAKARCADSFHVYLRQAVAVFYDQVETRNASPLQAEMINNRNKFLPFREHTPERLRFKGPEGPYREDRIRTSSGIFSAIIWRALTINTPSAMQEQIFFEDHDDWLTFVSKIPPTASKSYLIDICARITPMPGKSSEKASDYWASVAQLGWESKVVKKMSFMELYRLFHPAKNSQKRPFPFLGSIGAFHLVSDLAYTSIADKPTVQDVAECVTIIGRGAWNALKILEGDLEGDTAASNQPTIQASLEGLGYAQRLVLSSLTAQELEDTSFDLPTLEHLLCKFKGAWSKKMLV